MQETPLTVSGTTPSPGAKLQPFSAISQCVTDRPIVPCRPLRARKMSVRLAHGQASDT